MRLETNEENLKIKMGNLFFLSGQFITFKR